MEIFSHPDIQEIVSKEENSKCIDCGTGKPKWASINNGIFLCLKCAGIHRNLNNNFSIIRSLQIDSWDEKQMLFLKKGGNEKFKNLLNEYNIPLNSSIDEKYKCKAAHYYRKNLRFEVEKELNPNFISQEENIKPELNEGKEILDLSNLNNNINDDLLNEKKEKKIQEESFFGFFGNFLKKTGNKIVEKTKDVSKKIEEMKIGDKIKATGVGAVDFISNTKNLVVNKTQEVYNKSIIKDITMKAGEKINDIVDKTKNLLNPNENNNEDNKVKNEEEVKKEDIKKEEEGKNEEIKKEEEVKNEEIKKEEEVKNEEIKKEEEVKNEDIKKEEEKKE